MAAIEISDTVLLYRKFMRNCMSSVLLSWRKRFYCSILFLYYLPLPRHQSSTSSSSSTRALLVQGQKAVCAPDEQPEQNRTRKEKTDTQSRTRVSDSEACDDSRCVYCGQTHTHTHSWNAGTNCYMQYNHLFKPVFSFYSFSFYLKIGVVDSRKNNFKFQCLSVNLLHELHYTCTNILR